MLIRIFFFTTLFAAALSAAVVNYSYDGAGRLVKVDYGAGGSISYTYDNAGNLLSRTTVSPSAVAASNKKRPAAKPPKPEVKPDNAKAVVK